MLLRFFSTMALISGGAALASWLWLLTAAGPAAASSVSVLTYNAENLFDTQNHPHRQDNTFLPRSQKTTAEHAAYCEQLEFASRRRKCLRLDWNAAALRGKLKALASVIVAAGNPEIVVLQEVENRRLLEALRRLLKGYRTGVLLESQDRRGIDQAVLSRLKQAGRAKLHSGDALTDRGVLEVPLRLPNGEVLRVFAAHLPAPYHPQKLRYRALAALADLTYDSDGQSNMFVLAGDFNLTAEADRQRRTQRLLRPWLQAHLWCRPDCPGTHYFGGTRTWSWLDRILLPPQMRWGGEACWQLHPDGVRLVRGAPEQLTPSGYPRPYSAVSHKGASDHLPLLAELRRNCARSTDTR